MERACWNCDEWRDGECSTLPTVIETSVGVLLPTKVKTKWDFSCSEWKPCQGPFGVSKGVIGEDAELIYEASPNDACVLWTGGEALLNVRTILNALWRGHIPREP